MRATTAQVQNAHTDGAIARRQIDQAAEAVRNLELPADCDRYQAAANRSLKIAAEQVSTALRDLASIQNAIYQQEAQR